MSIGAQKIASMEAQIVNGIPKTESHLVTDAETSAAWDRLAAQIAEIRRTQPHAVIEVPNDPN